MEAPIVGKSYTLTVDVTDEGVTQAKDMSGISVGKGFVLGTHTGLTAAGRNGRSQGYIFSNGIVHVNNSFKGDWFEENSTGGRRRKQSRGKKSRGKKSCRRQTRSQTRRQQSRR